MKVVQNWIYIRYISAYYLTKLSICKILGLPFSNSFQQFAINDQHIVFGLCVVLSDHMQAYHTCMSTNDKQHELLQTYFYDQQPLGTLTQKIKQILRKKEILI